MHRWQNSRKHATTFACFSWSDKESSRIFKNRYNYDDTTLRDYIWFCASVCWKFSWIFRYLDSLTFFRFVSSFLKILFLHGYLKLEWIPRRVFTIFMTVSWIMSYSIKCKESWTLQYCSLYISDQSLFSEVLSCSPNSFVVLMISR